MTKQQRLDLPHAQRVENIPRMLEAMAAAVEDALARHKRDGNPVAIWRDGRVVLVPPDEIPARNSPR
jgi:hypothetical protein